MFDTICLYFSLCWSLLIDIKWWALYLVAGLVQIFLSKGVGIYIALAVTVLPMVLALGIFYLVMRGMHLVYWVRGFVIGICGVCALLAGTASLAAYSAAKAGDLFSTIVATWSDQLANYPRAWITDTPPASVKTRQAGISCYAELEFPSGEGVSVGEANRPVFEANARALGGMAKDAFALHFSWCPFITNLITIDTSEGEKEFVNGAIAFWNGNATDELPKGMNGRARAYTKERLAPIVNAVGEQACSAATTITWGITINMILLALLAILLGALAVFWDCECRIQRVMRSRR